jgi:hypothetical protein
MARRMSGWLTDSGRIIDELFLRDLSDFGEDPLPFFTFSAHNIMRVGFGIDRRTLR